MMDPVRIGILTLFSGYNEGATLQALGSVRAVAALGDPSLVAEVVDQRFTGLEDVIYGKPETPRQVEMVRFVSEELPRSEQTFKSRQGLESSDYISRKYAAVLVGADEVWKVSYKRYFRGLIRLQRDPWSPPFPNTFWAPRLSNDVHRIAHAASIGAKTEWRSFSRSVQQEMVCCLERFTALSVRDQRSLQMLRELAPQLADRTLIVQDPAFALGTLELSDIQIQKLAIPAEPFAVVIIRQSDIGASAIAELKRRKLKVIALTVGQDAADLDLSSAPVSPQVWGAILQRADVVVTERMHGAILALSGGRPVVGVDFRNPTYGIPTKLGELAERFQAGMSYINVSEESSNPTMSLSKALASAIERKATISQICQLIDEGEKKRADFLKAALTSAVDRP